MGKPLPRTNIAPTITINCTLDDAGNTTITYYGGSKDSMAIPATLQGHPATAIGDETFLSNEGLVSVILPEGLVQICREAFAKRSSLEDITLTPYQNMRAVWRNTVRFFKLLPLFLKNDKTVFEKTRPLAHIVNQRKN